MEFQQFLKALEFIAEKAHPGLELEEAYIYLVENYLLKLEERVLVETNTNTTFINDLMEVLKDPEVVEILNYVHKSLILYYNYYADSYGYMNFNNFIRFCRDFSLFPDVVSKPKLLRFFFALARIHAQTEVPKSTTTIEEVKAPEQTENELIDEHLFIEALVLIANEILYRDPQPSSTEKICYLMERMSQSDGPLKVRKAQGMNRSGDFDILGVLRRRYPHFFGMVENKKSTFSELLRSS